MEELKLEIEELEERIAPGNLTFPGETESILSNPGTQLQFAPPPHLVRTVAVL